MKYFLSRFLVGILADIILKYHLLFSFLGILVLPFRVTTFLSSQAQACQGYFDRYFLFPLG